MRTQTLVKYFILYSLILCSTFMLSNESLAVSAVIPKSDSVIQAQLQDKLAKDSVLSKTNIAVNVLNADVSFSGTVPDKQAAKKLIIMAESIAGVNTVDPSSLVLANGKTLSSDEITNCLVIGTFNREGLMGPLSTAPFIATITGPGTATVSTNPPPINIQVRTQDGVVYLSGSVPSQAVLDKAENLAAAISGVSQVQSTLTINTGH